VLLIILSSNNSTVDELLQNRTELLISALEEVATKAWGYVKGGVRVKIFLSNGVACDQNHPKIGADIHVEYGSQLCDRSPEALFGALTLAWEKFAGAGVDAQISLVQVETTRYYLVSEHVGSMKPRVRITLIKSSDDGIGYEHYVIQNMGGDFRTKSGDWTYTSLDDRVLKYSTRDEARTAAKGMGFCVEEPRPLPV
jgi:hypothetical protein